MIQKLYSTLEKINEALGEIVWGTPTIALIIAAGIILTYGNGFFQVRYISHWIRCTLGTLGRKKPQVAKSDSRQISQFQAVCGALASTIGTGNIAGVATAVSAGGPGAVFWMWISAFFGMMTSYSENALGIYYRRKNLSGQWCGGPMYYLRDGLGKVRGFSFLGKILAAIFCIFCILASFGMGNMAQVNTISEVMKQNYNIEPIHTGVTVACICAFVIIGGIKRIGSLTEKLVPAMALFYIFCSLTIFIMNFKSIPYVFSSIFQNAFSTRAIMGAGGGIVIQKSVSLGFKRGIFSNEAGLGSGVIIHSSSDTTEPAVQGMWGIFAVFVDTIVICTLTAFVILSTKSAPVSLSQGLMNLSDKTTYVSLSENLQAGEVNLTDTVAHPIYVPSEKEGIMFERSDKEYTYTNIMALRGIKTDKQGNEDDGSAQYIGKVSLEKLDGAALVTYAFSLKFGSWSGKLLSVAIILFAFSTVVGWSYYGVKSWEYLFGLSSSAIYKMLYVVCIVFGSTLSLGVIWDLSDILNALMSFPNLIGLLACSPTVFKITNNYIKRNIKGENILPMVTYTKKVQ